MTNNTKKYSNAPAGVIPRHGAVSSVHPGGGWIYTIHTPSYTVKNMRFDTEVQSLGPSEKGPVLNTRNFPAGDVTVPEATEVYEIPNAFFFRGATYIDRSRADRVAGDENVFQRPAPDTCSLAASVSHLLDDAGKEALTALFRTLPCQVRLAVAQTSTDARDLTCLADIACDLEYDAHGQPTGVVHHFDAAGHARPIIHDVDLFETVVNNPALPDSYKHTMVLKPGIQGGSDIVGQVGRAGDPIHVYEYLRRNSYIPFGHYAANMADDAVRYSIDALSLDDFSALRHLYYQRSYLRFAAELGIHTVADAGILAPEELEEIRLAILEAIAGGARPFSDATLWGWNYGYDFAPSGFRLNASHQQIHQQYALVPAAAQSAGDARDQQVVPFCCGDLVGAAVESYRAALQADLFSSLEQALRTNRRMDGRDDLPHDLLVLETDGVLLFVPKAQTSHMELQIMPAGGAGNILETDTRLRHGLDRALWTGMRLVAACGGRLVTAIEYSKRISAGDNGQRIVYDLLPKMEHSPMTFSQTQHRWIVGHYPEDFAAACRRHLRSLERA